MVARQDGGNMKKQRSPMWVISIYLISCLTPLVVQASDDTKFKVQLLVASKEHKERIISFISRELRSLDDVEIVKEDPDYAISVIAIVSRDFNSEVERGVAVSYTITKQSYFHKHIIKQMDDENVSNISMKTVRPLLYFPHLHYLQTGPPDSLMSICEEIVATLNAEELEPRRKENLELKELIGRGKSR
jgi:hypothetical protein